MWAEEGKLATSESVRQVVAGRDNVSYGSNVNTFDKVVKVEVNGVEVAMTFEVAAKLFHRLRRDLPQELIWAQD